MFGYRHLFHDPVFECNSLWYMRVGDTRAVVLRHIDGSTIRGFEDGWSAVFIYAGLAPLYLLALKRKDRFATWIIDADGKRLGDKLTDLQPDHLDLLRETVSSRALAEPTGLVEDGLQFIEPMLLREILKLGAGAGNRTAGGSARSSYGSLAMMGAPYRMQTRLRYGSDDQVLLLQDGWVVDEAGHCRAVGTTSVASASLVPVMSRYLLTLDLVPCQENDEGTRKQQSVELYVNDCLIASIRLDLIWQRDGACFAFWLSPELIYGQPFRIMFRHAQDFMLDGLKLEQSLVPQSAALDPTELMMKFENIGDNCEFGLVQRHFDADPIGLLRFAGLENPRRLIHFLDDNFGDFGNPGSLDVVVVAGEYWIVNRVYNISYHTFRYQHEVSAAEVLRENEIKSRYLMRKFLEDLEDGEKILVYKRAVTQDLNEIVALHAALNRFGRINKLFWVTEADESHVPGEVEWVGDRILRGYVRHISLTNAHHFDPGIWLDLCRNAHAVFEAANRGVHVDTATDVSPMAS